MASWNTIRPVIAAIPSAKMPDQASATTKVQQFGEQRPHRKGLSGSGNIKR